MTVRNEYRETRTRDYYVMRFETDDNGVWRAYAEHHPHNPYDTHVTSCHLYPDKEVCVDHKKFCPRTLDQIKACAYLWMEAYSQYVRHGVFPATGGRVNV